MRNKRDVHRVNSDIITSDGTWRSFA